MDHTINLTLALFGVLLLFLSLFGGAIKIGTSSPCRPLLWRSVSLSGHSDGLIAVFSAGLVLNRFLGEELQETKEHVHEALRCLFELPAFVILGIILPWASWFRFGWQALAFAIAVVLLSRLPIMTALRGLIPPLTNDRETVFVGWFGPIGLAAMLYALVGKRKTGLEEVWAVTTLVIVLRLPYTTARPHH